jgi:hypothetical protein
LEVGPCPEQQRGHRDEGVGGIEIAAGQKPADDTAETPPAQSPFVELIEIAAPSPSTGNFRNEVVCFASATGAVTIA